jgi:bromodomain adjacent to zinc finger domain protein 1A
MDLASIKNNINHFKYTDYTSILDDIRLIFSNCREYNEPSSEIYKAGQRLNNFFEKQVKQLNLL